MSVVLTKFGQMRIIDSDPVISRSLSLYGEWAMDELNLMSELIQPGMCVLDVGAFIGTHSLALSSFVGVAGKVFSFEPRREIFDILNQNLVLNNCENVTTLNMGLAEVEGEIQLNALNLNGEINFGGLALVQNSSDVESETYSAHISTIDIVNFDRIDLIKVDVEGMERKVLDGAVKTIRRDRPIIICECNSVTSGSEILSWCKEFNYDTIGYLASAFNKDNFNKVDNNIWGNAKELALLLVPDEKAEVTITSIEKYSVFCLKDAEDLVLPLLHKPQYAHEILTNTAAFNLFGIGYPSQISAESDLTLQREVEKNMQLNKQLIKLSRDIANLEKLLSSHEAYIENLNASLDLYKVQNSHLSEINTRQTNLSDNLRLERDNLSLERDNLSLERDNLSLERDNLSLEIDKLHASTSWKITSPMRAFVLAVRKFINLARLMKRYAQTSPGLSEVTELLKKCLVVVKRGGVKNLKDKVENFKLILYKAVSDAEKLGNPIKKFHAQIKKGVVSTSTIIFDHNGGGGSNTYTFELIKNILQKKEHVLRVYYFDGIWFVQWITEGARTLYSTPSAELLFTVLRDTPGKDIILNSLYGHPDIAYTVKKIISLGKALDAKIDFKMHDFYALCPSLHLSDFEQKYCGVPQASETCNKCLKINVSWYHPWFPEENRPTEIAAWRKPFAELFDSVAKVTFFDQSGVDILKRGFSLNSEKVNIVPHVITHFTCDKSIDIDGPLHIGVFGTLSHIKGGNAVRELCEFIEAQGLAIPVTIVGHSYTELPTFVDIHGVYKTSDLPEIVRSKGINIVLMLSPIPETFSYTISEAMQMGLPIVAFDIGAQGNRVSSYPMGSVIPADAKPADILEVIQSTLVNAQELNITC